MPRTKEDKSKYDQEYQKTHMKRISVWFNLEKDRELIAWMDRSGMSKSELVKTALRNEMRRSGGEK